MRQSLAGAAVRGANIVLSPEQRRLLTEGDIEGLLELHRSMLGFAVMVEGEADEDDDTDDSDDGDDEDDDEEDEDDDSKEIDPKDRRIQELSAEGKKKRLRIRDQRNKIAELEAQIAKGKPVKKVEPEDKDDTPDNSELERTNANLSRTNEDLLIRLEFMASKKHSWKNPMAALKVLDLSDVEINDDGDVEGLEEAIEDLAKSDPYLLDTGKQDEEDKTKKRRGPTGQPTGGTRKGNPNRDKLINKYPALRR